MSDGALPENVKKLLHDAAAKLKAAPASNDPKQTYEEAIELTKRATEKSPDTSEVWSEYAMALLCLNRREKAWEAYRKSLALSKGRPKSMKFCSRAQAVQFARMHEEHGKLDDAEEQLNLLTDHSPKYPGGWLELARFYLRTDRIEDAEFTLTHGLHEVEHETLYLALAQVQALHGRMDQALYRAKEALSAKPEFFEALMYVALFAHRLQRDKEETEALTKAAEIVEKHPEMKSSYENMLDLINNSEVVVFWQK
ncbi:MAG: tetratricopeptide repeat protein, partial [Candidatus Thorarchaeota archaeon]